jgi:predicted alpha/beta hydrolase family esterase
VAHSFGCLTAAHWARRHGSHRIRAALLVAPANPARFCLDAAYSMRPCPFHHGGDQPQRPLVRRGAGRAQAHRWGAAVWDAGLAGHINVDSGHGPWPLGEALVRALASTTERPPPQRPRAGEPHPASTAPQPRLFHPRKHVFIRSAPQDRFPE